MLTAIDSDINQFRLEGDDFKSLSVVNYRQAEYYSLLGESFYFEIDKSFENNEVLWIKFVPPINKNVRVLTRQMSPELAGCVYELFSDTSGFTIDSTIDTRNFMSGGPVASSVINTLSVPTTTGTKYCTPIFIGKGGGNANARAGGTYSSESGFWIYPEGSAGFVGRISNTSGATNRIVFRFEFCEI